MAFHDLLVHLDSTQRAGERLRLAVALARRHGARLTAVFAEGSSLGGTLIGRRTPQAMERAGAEAREAFESATRDAGLETAWIAIPPGEAADVVGWIAICSRYFDLCVLGQHDPEHQLGRPARQQPAAHVVHDLCRVALDRIAEATATLLYFWPPWKTVASSWIAAWANHFG